MVSYWCRLCRAEACEHVRMHMSRCMLCGSKPYEPTPDPGACCANPLPIEPVLVGLREFLGVTYDPPVPFVSYQSVIGGDVTHGP